MNHINLQSKMATIETGVKVCKFYKQFHFTTFVEKAMIGVDFGGVEFGEFIAF